MSKADYGRVPYTLHSCQMWKSHQVLSSNYNFHASQFLGITAISKVHLNLNYTFLTVLNKYKKYNILYTYVGSLFV